MNNSSTSLKSLVPPDQLAREVETLVRQVVDQMIPETAKLEIPIGISARHCHITQEHLEILFGPGHQLTKFRDLNQPGEFAAKETVTVVGPNRRVFERVRILGPTRKFTQVELAYTDGVYLGIDLPLRISGNIKNSAPIILVGPKGVLHLPEGAIRAMRHIHMDPQVAASKGLKAGDTVDVQVPGPLSVTFHDVVLRTGEGLKTEMHIDTDEANTAGLDPRNAVGLLVKGE